MTTAPTFDADKVAEEMERLLGMEQAQFSPDATPWLIGGLGAGGNKLTENYYAGLYQLRVMLRSLAGEPPRGWHVRLLHSRLLDDPHRDLDRDHPGLPALPLPDRCPNVLRVLAREHRQAVRALRHRLQEHLAVWARLCNVPPLPQGGHARCDDGDGAGEASAAPPCSSTCGPSGSSCS